MTESILQAGKDAINTISNRVSAMSLPKTYKAGAFEEAHGPLVFKDYELTPPKAGEVSMSPIVYELWQSIVSSRIRGKGC